MSFVRANVVGGIAGIAGATLSLLVFITLHGTAALDAVADVLYRQPGLVLVVMLLSIIAHEALHGIGFYHVGRVPGSSVRFGINWKTLTPFAGTSAPMPAAAYRWSLVLPGLVLGVVPALYSLLSGSGTVAAFGAFMVAGAGGDAAALWAMRSVPPHAIVRDAETRVGCEVVTPAPESAPL